MSKDQPRAPLSAASFLSSPDPLAQSVTADGSSVLNYGSLKRPRDANDEGDRRSKLPTWAANVATQFTFQPLVFPTSTSAMSLSSKAQLPPSILDRQPLGPTNPNVTLRSKRAKSAPPKPFKPGATGVVSGRRAADAGFQNILQTKISKLSKITDSGRSDPQWEIFLAKQGKPVTQTDSQHLGPEIAADQARSSSLQTEVLALQSELRTAQSQELEQRRALNVTNDNLADIKRKHARDIQSLEADKGKVERELKDTREDLRLAQHELRIEQETSTRLKSELSQQATIRLKLETQLAASQTLARSLQAEAELRISSTSDLQIKYELSEKRVLELEAEVRENEALRRKLHNQIQELKGNIRVFCRVRPPLPSEKDASGGVANISFPDTRDNREIVFKSTSESAMGSERKEVVSFSFDRVFQPHSTQMEVFEEVSQLIQSVTDGYNVTIFAYGQTGSGKSYTMEGGPAEFTQGMIPRAVKQVFATGEQLRTKGWEYKMTGQFLEIYNEAINDLLGHGEFDKKKHDIKHDKAGRTSVKDVVNIPLTTPQQVASLLSRAQSRRSVAATLMNERSSRSHSVFTLRVTGANCLTGERCEGCLNLVDLAGSERLSSSGAANDKDRLKETQSINKSLSALGDVIAALGTAGGNGESKSVHIPYRNSKLTYLLQNSLGGNSKSLMVLNLSPMVAHYGESMCSLRFATKVNNTTIGPAKKQQVR